MTSESLRNSNGRAFPLLVACPVAVTLEIQLLRLTLPGVDPLGLREPQQIAHLSLELGSRGLRRGFA